MPRMSNAEFLSYVRRQAGVNSYSRQPADQVAEKELHQVIMDDCASRGWIALHGAMSQRTHRTLGEPDFVVLADGGKVLLVECKSKTGKLSVVQSALHAWARKLGHTVHVVRSPEEWLALV